MVPEWNTFERQYVRSGIPHAIVVRSDPQVAIFIDQFASRLGLRFRRRDEPAWAGANPLVEVRIAEVAADGDRFLEMWTDSRELFRNFYDLAGEVVTDVVVRGIDPVTALAAAVDCWEALLARPSLLSEEAQTGLFGELWLLDRVLSAQGPAALDAWVGPEGHAHDFRLGEAEFEVKTTSGPRRVHTINGTGQLQPSAGSRLFLLSLRLTDAGAGGHTLTEMVATVRDRLGSDGERRAKFYDKLGVVHYRDEDAAHYPRRRKLRAAAALIEVMDGVPRLTDEALAAVDPRFAPERLGQITYDIDVEKLGFEDGSPEFLQVLPAPAKRD
jgi:hypothetical protein